MFNFRNEVFVCNKSELLDCNNWSFFKEKGINTILLCCEYIDVEIYNHHTLSKHLTENKIKIKSLFDTQTLIESTVGVYKKSDEFKLIRNELREKQMTSTNVLEDVLKTKEPLLLVCNKNNKMSPTIFLMIQKHRYGIEDISVVDRIVSGKTMESNFRRKEILKCYDQFIQPSFS